ncbi:hypothetical protein D9757_008469 [Collybiopsis confluens]|uniref:Xylanolytic transcriptional activator regulatory domain-containing protein n=1 Tax=Collybiopsis confluens TaxID=2823264 RepID=A0A8H5HEZ8_9AGAR|nr:hypothetical protein D9757_008469 [Collybiopsis confluens]
MLVSGLPGHDYTSSRPLKRARNWGTLEPLAGSGNGGGVGGSGQYQDPPQAHTQYHDFTQTTATNDPLSASPYKEKEKTSNRTLSCRECRRLKLKCDRNFPCQFTEVFIKGTLTSGKGSRFILANTGQLHAKISQLSDRVRVLEEALREECISRQHPLLAPELLQIKTIQEFYGISSSSSASASVFTAQSESSHHRDGDSLHQAVTSLSLDSVTGQNENPNNVYIDENGCYRTRGPPEVPPDVLQLSATFPFPWPADLKLRKSIRDALPPREEAQLVCKAALDNALWQYNLDASETFLSNLLHHVYESKIEDTSPRRLALLLMVLSIGSLVDLKKPLGNLYGEAYHHMARASVCEIPLMEEPDFDTLHALFFMIWYHLIFSDNRKAVGYAWNLMGFVAKLAQGLGLHREGSRIKRIPEEHEKRRYIFWELLNLDCRMSLSLGRPPSIRLDHVDVKAPTFDGPGLYVPQGEMIYHEWKNRFFIHCLSPILDAITSVNVPPYERIVGLDKDVRNFGIPDILKEDGGSEAGLEHRFLTMQRALVSMGRDIALLQLHRRQFMEVMSSPEKFDWNDPFAPSVLATYLGCAELIVAVEILFNKEEQLSGRFLCFWFNAFSASVALSLLVSREPSCALAPNALADLDRVCRLFRRAAKILPFSARTLPVIEKMFEKSRRAYFDWHESNTGGGIGGISTQLLVLGSASPIQSSPAIESCSPPYITQAFTNAHVSLHQFLQDLYTNPPPPVLPVLTTMRSGLGANGLGNMGHGLLVGSSSSSSQSVSIPSAFQPLPVGGAFRQGFQFDFNFLGRPRQPPSLAAAATAQSYTTPWLPDIYSFHSAGVGVDETYSYRENFAQAPPTPFMPSSPRVGEDEKINLDHGALMMDLEETSFMAWF